MVEWPTFIAASLCLMRYRHFPLRISVQQMLQDKQPGCAAVSEWCLTRARLTGIQIGEGRVDRAQDLP